MKIRIYQRGGSKRRHSAYRDAIAFYAQELGISKVRQELLNVKLEIRSAKLLYGFGGFACSLDPTTGRRPLIRLLRTMSFRASLVILAHEMIHVEQMVNKRLVHKPHPHAPKSYWNGVDHTETPYKERPWEIAAYAGQMELAAKFVAKRIKARKAAK